MRTLLLTFVIYITFPFGASSQSYFTGNIKEDLLKGRVKQVEEFIARFNYEEDWEGKKVNDSTDHILRTKYIQTLFDYTRFRGNDGKLLPIAEQFVQDVVKYRYLIHFTDSTWVAKVKCKAMVDRKTKDITLFLRPEQVAPHEYLWVISGAESPLFANVSDTTSRTVISPIEHEIGFTGLLSLSSSREIGVSHLFPKNTNFDHLSMLAVLLRNGILKVTEIEDVSFHFFNVPGYAFTVERVERKNSYNTGWLITNLNPL